VVDIVYGTDLFCFDVLIQLYFSIPLILLTCYYLFLLMLFILIYPTQLEIVTFDLKFFIQSNDHHENDTFNIIS